MITDERVSLATDLTFGMALLTGVLLARATSLPVATGYMIGISIGYAIHAGSQMAEFSTSVADDSSE